MEKILEEDYLASLTEDERVAYSIKQEAADDEFARELVAAFGYDYDALLSKFADGPSIEEYLGETH